MQRRKVRKNNSLINQDTVGEPGNQIDVVQAAHDGDLILARDLAQEEASTDIAGQG